MKITRHTDLLTCRLFGTFSTSPLMLFFVLYPETLL